MPRWTDDQWQRAADVAQFYLHAAGEQLAAVLGHPSVDVERCELVLREAAELGFMPKNRDDLMSWAMKTPDGWPTFPGDENPPLL